MHVMVVHMMGDRQFWDDAVMLQLLRIGRLQLGMSTGCEGSQLGSSCAGVAGISLSCPLSGASYEATV